MALLQIIYIPDPILRRKARRVTDFGPEFQRLVDDMIETMRAAPGVGLAAPQVAVSQRLVVVEYGEEEDENAPKKLYVIANPDITQVSAETEIGIEGCLSVPDLVGDVERFTQITIKGQNRRGQPMRVKAIGWLARIFQHEIDHLDAVLYVDRATRIWKPSPEEAKLIKD
jgi:peptide deformylase